MTDEPDTPEPSPPQPDGDDDDQHVPPGPMALLKTGYTATRAFLAPRPRWQLITVPVVLVALLAAVITVAALPAYPLGPDVEVDTDRTITLLEDLPAEPDRSAADQSGSGARDIPDSDAEPTWSFDDLTDDTGRLTEVAGGGFVFEGGDGLTGLDAKGRSRWENDSDGSVAVGGEVIVVSSKIDGDGSWPGKKKTTLTDVATGRKLWSDSTASFSSAWYGQVYLSRCQGGQDGELGECVVTAHDARSGATRWSRSTYASTSVVEASPDGSFVVFQSHVTSGADIRHTVVDTATGAVLSGGSDQDGYGGGEVFVIDDLVITVGGDDNPADDCRLPAKAVDVRTGAKVWERELGADIEEGGDFCGDLDGQLGEHIMAYDGDRKPIAVDLRTGKTVWTAPDKGRPLLTDGEYALMESKKDEVEFHDIDADKRLWKLPEGLGVGGLKFGEKYVYIDTGEGVVKDNCWIRVELKTGDPQRYPGGCVGSGPDWIAASGDSGGLRVYPVE